MALRGRLLTGLVLSVLLLAGGSVGAEPLPGSASATARGFAISILIPNVQAVTIAPVAAPPDAEVSSSPFAWPGDGSVVTADSASASAATEQGSVATASASAVLTKLSLFGGEVTADSVSARARATAGSELPSGDFSDAGVSNLVVLGQAVTPQPGASVQLADWGHAVVLEQQVEEALSAEPSSYRGTMTVLDVVLDADHGGLPAGTRIQIGYAEASAEAAAVVQEQPPAVQPPAAQPSTPAGGGQPAAPKARPVTPAGTGKPSPPKRKRPGRAVRAPEPRRPGTGGAPRLTLPPTTLTPKLTAGGYVFPVYGPAGYSDTFGAPRADVAYHHGDDIFAPLGAPVLAVADGTVFSVGWNDLGGNRLWLRDRKGNQFYYAHLSAYSALAVNGAQVKAGDVIGFVGSSGDADGTPYHLHFEIHPVSLLFLGYDGAVDPTSYLDAWRRLEDLPFIPAALGWAPAVARSTNAPIPGAILLQSTDISTANGLEPDSLERALAPSATANGAAQRGPAARASS